MFVKKEINLTTDAGDSIAIIADQEEGFNLCIGNGCIDLLVDEVNELADTLMEAVDYYNSIKDVDITSEDDEDEEPEESEEEKDAKFRKEFVEHSNDLVNKLQSLILEKMKKMDGMSNADRAKWIHDHMSEFSHETLIAELTKTETPAKDGGKSK